MNEQNKDQIIACTNSYESAIWWWMWFVFSGSRGKTTVLKCFKKRSILLNTVLNSQFIPVYLGTNVGN